MAKFTLKEIREIRATTPAELADRTYKWALRGCCFSIWFYCLLGGLKNGF